jgi:hypothetical protein
MTRVGSQRHKKKIHGTNFCFSFNYNTQINFFLLYIYVELFVEFYRLA